MTSISIDSMKVTDVEAVANLAEQLGYPSTAEIIQCRFLSILENKDFHHVFIASLNGKREAVVGWIHIYHHLSLTTPPRTDIAGLVVDGKSRGKGIGAKLMNAAEQWARERGLGLIRLSSQTSRSDAHRFYEKLGYKICKTSHVFSKDL